MSAATDWETSLAHCRSITRRSATSFYYAFKTLPRRKREGFEVVYAFMRLSDDLSDDESGGERRGAMAEWRGLLERALAGETAVHPVMPALVRVLDDFEIEPRLLFELIEGTEQDLDVVRYETFGELERYCYLVASTVGLVCVRLFGLADPSPARWREIEPLAIDNGLAFQLTNILRDVKEDVERGRVYLPQEDLRRFGLSDEDLARGRMDDRIRELMRFEVARAEERYRRSRPLVDLVASDARACLVTMRGIYHGILEQIVAQNHDVWSRRARVTLPRKLGIAARAWLGIGEAP